MKTVGLRELKNRLAAYIREVRSGDGVLVTDRGEVVAELDAIHLASALTARSGVAGVELLSLDDRVRRSGAQLGFRLQPT